MKDTKNVNTALWLVCCGYLAQALTSVALADEKQDIRNAYMAVIGDYGTNNPLNAFSNVFTTIDRDQNGINQAEVSLFESRDAAQQRGATVGQWLSLDLNGDFKVSRQEIESLFDKSKALRLTRDPTDDAKRRIQEETDKQVLEMMRADIDSSGTVESSEMFNPIHGEAKGRFTLGIAELARALVSADPNKDGILTQVEASMLLASSLAGVENEVEELRAKKTRILTERKATARNERKDAFACPKLNVSKNSKLVVAGFYEGANISTVTMAGQDQETSAATIVIEPGSESLTVFMVSYDSVIWRFVGATDRIEKLYLTSHQATPENGKSVIPAVATFGLPKEKVEFLPTNSCYRYFSNSSEPEGLKMKSVITRQAGREPDAFFGAYYAHTVLLPSGAGTDRKTSKQPQEAITKQANATFLIVGRDGQLVPREVTSTQANDDEVPLDRLRYAAAEILKFEPQELVSPAKPESYEVLPKEAGLAQLVASHKLEIMENFDNSYKIKSKIRIPSGLYGGYSVRFLLGVGVPEPDGKLGHSCMSREDKSSGDANKDC